MNIHAQTTCNARDLIIGTGLVALDRIHIDDEEPLFEELGGSCGNVLISLAMLGRTVTPLLRLGTDPVGTRLEQELRSAGVDTRLVTHSQDVRSPVIVQLLDLVSSEHTFAFTCPSSSERFGTFQPITWRELEPARTALSLSSIFYADRVSDTICDAMEAAAAGGAIVHFEPSGICAPIQFERAMSIAHIFKYSADRLSPELADRVRPEVFSIVTAGRAGLEVRHAGQAFRCEAFNAEVVRDTCGAGDMVTLGLLDTIIQSGICGPSSLSIDIVLSGIRSGLRLAAANCAYIGARGIFRERGPQAARAILTDA